MIRIARQVGLLLMIVLYSCHPSPVPKAKRWLPPVDSVGLQKVSLLNLELFRLARLVNKSVKIIDDEGPALDALPAQQKEPGPLVFRTRRDCRALMQSILDTLGRDTIQLSPGYLRSLGHIHWLNLNFLGRKKVEICFESTDEVTYTQLNITVWDEFRFDISQNPEVIDFFAALIRKNTLTQPLVYTAPMHLRNPVNFNFCEFLHLNPDSLIQALKDSTVSESDPQVDVNLNKWGELTSFKFAYSERKLRIPLAAYLEKINFPLVIHQRSGDTVSYNLTLDLTVSESYYIEWIMAKLGKELKQHKTGQYDIVPGADSSYYREIVMGDLCGNGSRYCLVCNPAKPSIYIFQIRGDSLVLNSTLHNLPEYQTTSIFLEDLDGDGLKEIITASCPNSNGNEWLRIIHYDKQKGTFYYAGWITSGYLVNKERKEIHVSYAGSWYMPVEETVYGWMNGKLIQKKQKVTSLLETNMIWPETKSSHYYNPYFNKGIDTLVLGRQEGNPESIKEIFTTTFFKLKKE